MVRKHSTNTSRKSLKKASLKTASSLKKSVPISSSKNIIPKKNNLKKSSSPSSTRSSMKSSVSSRSSGSRSSSCSSKVSSRSSGSRFSSRSFSVDIFNRSEGMKLKKILATVILLSLIGFVFYSLLPFLNAFLGSILVYFLFRPLNTYLIKKKGLSKSFSAGLLLLLVLLVITIPLFFGVKLLISEVTSMNINNETVGSVVGFVEKLLPSVNVVDLVKEQVSALGTFVKNLAISAVSNVANLVIDWILFFFTLFYLFYNSEEIANNSKYLLPFSEKNRSVIFEEFKKITNSTVIATGAIGALQGVFMGLAFYVFGIPNPVLWGFLSMIFAILPVIGISFIWIPAALFLAFVNGTYGLAIGFAIWGFIVTNIDYVFLRPWIQKRMGKLHPLTTLIGIFMGVPVFGLLGLIFGPLLLSFVILLTKIYLEEHLGI